MEEKDVMNVAFYFNQEFYDALSDDAKMELLLVIQALIDSEMKKLILTNDIPEA